MNLEKLFQAEVSRRKVVKIGVKAAVSGIYLATSIPIDSEPNVDFLPQGTFYNSRYWWPFDRNYAAQIGQPWIFADNGPLDAYERAHYELRGEVVHLREMWREYAQRKLRENAHAVTWMGLCHAEEDMIYHEKKPQAGQRYTLQQNWGVRTLWHAADIPISMSLEVESIDYVLNKDGDWFIANIPRAPGSFWYHLIIARNGNQVLGNYESLDNTPKSFPLSSLTEAYRPYPFGPDKDISELSPQLQKRAYETTFELHDQTMKREVVDYMLIT